MLKSITVFRGCASYDTTDWIFTTEDVGRAQGWRLPSHRHAAISKLEGEDQDWHVVEGSAFLEWPERKPAILKIFVRELSIE